MSTDDEHRFYILRRSSRKAPGDACDGCSRQVAEGYVLLYIDTHAPAVEIAGWCCRIDCAINTINAHEC